MQTSKTPRHRGQGRIKWLPSLKTIELTVRVVAVLDTLRRVFLGG